jgi:NAD(P)-dependent dehydrogenase (short-subunit alcohol dehydrogenase family)
MLPEGHPFSRSELKGKTIVITGAGGGIGLEAAKAMAWLGAKVFLPEISREKGRAAEQTINELSGGSNAEFYEIDLSDTGQIETMADYIETKYGCPDVLFHNAVFVEMGAVDAVPVSSWDKSYAVNFRAPLLLTQRFLPQMKRRNSGTVVFVPSSGAAPYMGAYEVFKTAQVELCNTLVGELEGYDVYAFSIGPGLVKTSTAQKSISLVVSMMGISEEEFYRMNEKHILGAEEAGLGFALSLLYAGRYHGQEIGSIQVLHDAGLTASEPHPAGEVSLQDREALKARLQNVCRVFEEQYDGWMKRNVFERQWVLRDFKKTVGLSCEQFRERLSGLGSLAAREAFQDIPGYRADLVKLKAYYEHQHKLLLGYEKNPEQLARHSAVLLGWIEELDSILSVLTP